MPTAASAATSVNASRPTPAQRYQSRNPSTIAVTAASRAAGPRSASNTAAAAALRCTGPIVSWGRSGPQTVSGRRSSAVLPTCTSRAGPAGESCTGRAPTVMTCPNATTSRPGVSAIVVGMPASRQNATSATVGHWRRAVRRLRRSYRAAPSCWSNRRAQHAPCVPWTEGAGGRAAIPGAPAPPAARRRRRRDPARTARPRRAPPRRPGGRAARPRAPRAEQPLRAELLVAAAALGDAVGVEQQRVAGASRWVVHVSPARSAAARPRCRARPTCSTRPSARTSTGCRWPGQHAARTGRGRRRPVGRRRARTSAAASVRTAAGRPASIITSLSSSTASVSGRPSAHQHPQDVAHAARCGPRRAAPLPQTSPIETSQLRRVDGETS